jgi:hypothetical protein
MLLALFEVFTRALSARADLFAAGLDELAFIRAVLSRPFAFVSLFDLLGLGSDLLTAGAFLVFTLAFRATDLLARARLFVDPLRVLFWAFIVWPI